MRTGKKGEPLTKEEVIKKEKQKLNKICKEMDPKLQKATESLVEEAAFMAASLYELREIINKKGYTEEYQNGANQKGTKKTSEVEIYNTMIKNYQNTVKQLTDLIKKDDKKTPAVETDGFEDLLKRR